MKAEELRIGNYINWEQTTHIVSGLPNFNLVRSYWIKDSIAQTEEEYQGFIEEAKPIPLNEEWLLKLGFVKEKGMLHGLDKFKLFLPCINKPILTYSQRSISVSNGSFSLEMKYVHQIQNLYYALTGEELTVNKT